MTRTTARARVLVVEDHAFTRTTVCGALRESGIDVVADTGTAAEALDLAARHKPDAAVLDLDLGEGPNGADLAAELRDMFPAIGIVMLTSYADPRLTGRNVDHLPGAAVYLIKSDVADAGVVAEAIVSAARMAGDPDLAGRPMLPGAAAGTANMTDAQVEVARLVAEGLTNAEIAARRGVGETAVERLIMRIAREMGIDATSAGNRRVLIAREFLRQAGRPS